MTTDQQRVTADELLKLVEEARQKCNDVPVTRMEHECPSCKAWKALREQGFNDQRPLIALDTAEHYAHLLQVEEAATTLYNRCVDRGRCRDCGVLMSQLGAEHVKGCAVEPLRQAIDRAKREG